MLRKILNRLERRRLQRELPILADLGDHAASRRRAVIARLYQLGGAS
jgi:hypothetical protein